MGLEIASLVEHGNRPERGPSKVAGHHKDALADHSLCLFAQMETLPADYITFQVHIPQ